MSALGNFVIQSMTETFDLRAFVGRALEQHGCVLEHERDGFQALLSSLAAAALLSPRAPDAAPSDSPLVAVRFLKSEREAERGAPTLSMMYGSESLRALCALAERSGGTAAAYFGELYLPRERLEAKVRTAFQWVKLRPVFAESAERVHSYLISYWRYRLVSEIVADGMVETGTSEQTGAVVDDLVSRLAGYRGSPDVGIGEFEERCQVRLAQGGLFSRSARAAEALLDERLGDFRASMARRRERDLRRIDDYHESMVREIEALIERRHLSGEERLKREEKIALVRREQQAKRLDIEAKYATEGTLSLIAAERFFVPVVVSRFSVFRGTAQREVEIVWNPLTKAFDPLACARCTSGMYIIGACEQWHWLCPACARPCEQCGSTKFCRMCVARCPRCAKKQ